MKKEWLMKLRLDKAPQFKVAYGVDCWNDIFPFDLVSSLNDQYKTQPVSRSSDPP